MGSPLPTTIQNQDLMSQKDALGNNGPQTTGLNQPDDGDDRMQEKGENVAHAPDGIKLKKFKSSGLVEFACDRILLVESPQLKLPTDWSRDGRFLINTIMNDSASFPVTLLLNWQPPAK